MTPSAPSESLLERLRATAVGFAHGVWIYLLLAALLTIVIAVGNGGVTRAPTVDLFIGTLAFSLSIAAASELVAALTVRAPWMARRSSRVRALATGLTLAVGVLVGAQLCLAVLTRLAPATSVLFPLDAVLWVAFPSAGVMSAIGFARASRAEERALRQEVEHKLEVARLAALTARTDPHFLFNALNTVAALIPEDPGRAERAVLRLSALFRYVLEGASAAHVRLGDEVAFVRAYLELEALRSGERLHTHFDVPARLELLSVPPLLLQPLAENAVKHGLSTRPAKLHVSLVVETNEDELAITIEDDGPGPLASRHRGAGTSHADLRQRLELLYGSRARLETGARPEGGFRARLILPRSPDESPYRR